MIDETPPFIDKIPQTESEWEELYDIYAKEKFVKQLTTIREITIEISAKAESVKARLTRAKSRQSRAQLRVSLATYEKELAKCNRNFAKVDEVLKRIDELRRSYVDVIGEQNKELVDEYNERIKSLTTLGLSTARLPNESDEDYVTRINENVNAMTLEEQLFDGQLFLIREFLAKMRTINVPLDVIESLNKHIPDDVKEWVLTAWPLVKKEFISMYGTNPYRVNTEHAYDFIMKMHAVRDVSQNPTAVRVTTNNIPKVTYLMNKFKTKMESAGVAPKIVNIKTSNHFLTKNINHYKSLHNL